MAASLGRRFPPQIGDDPVDVFRRQNELRHRPMGIGKIAFQAIGRVDVRLRHDLAESRSVGPGIVVMEFAHDMAASATLDDHNRDGLTLIRLGNGRPGNC